MNIFIEQILNGLTLGLSMHLWPSGFPHLWGCGDHQFRPWQIFMLGAYAFFMVYPWNGPVPYALAVVLTMISSSVLGSFTSVW